MAARLDVTQLRTFVAVTECGGQERAASALHLSQPSVSKITVVAGSTSLEGVLAAAQRLGCS